MPRGPTLGAAGQTPQYVLKNERRDRFNGTTLEGCVSWSLRGLGGSRLAGSYLSDALAVGASASLRADDSAGAAISVARAGINANAVAEDL